MRAINVNSYLFNLTRSVGEIEHEVTGALLAGHLLADKFAVHTQFAAAVRTMDVVTAKRQFHDVLDFLEGNEFRNLNAVGLEIGIQERPAIATMDDPFGHLLAACRARSTWPRGHFVILLKREVSSAGTRSPARHTTASTTCKMHEIRHSDQGPVSADNATPRPDADVTAHVRFPIG
jgi:hypothetical protein